MDTHQITEQIVAELNLPEWHDARAKLQIWFELMKTWREYGDPREIQLYRVADAAIRCVDKLVEDQIINPRSSAELRAQLTICKVIWQSRMDYTG